MYVFKVSTISRLYLASANDTLIYFFYVLQLLFLVIAQIYLFKLSKMTYSTMSKQKIQLVSFYNQFYSIFIFVFLNPYFDLTFFHLFCSTNACKSEQVNLVAIVIFLWLIFVTTICCFCCFNFQFSCFSKFKREKSSFIYVFVFLKILTSFIAFLNI